MNNRTPPEIARLVLYAGLVLAGLVCLVAAAFMGRDDLWGAGIALIGYAVPAFNVNAGTARTTGQEP